MNSPSEKFQRIRSGVAATLCFGLVSVFYLPAAAATDYYKFYNGTTSYGAGGGVYSAAGTVYDSTQSLSTICPNSASSCGSDVFSADGGSLTFAGGAGVLTATATVNSAGGTSGIRVWDDLAPVYGGLGVDTLSVSGSDEDQISAREVLKLSFANQVMLTGVATLFDSGHTGFGTGFGTVQSVKGVASTINFEISLDGSNWSDVGFSAANNNGLSFIGDTFYFRQEMAGTNPSFYVGAIAVTAVPEPETYAMLLAGLGLLGFAARRRKQKEAATA